MSSPAPWDDARARLSAAQIVPDANIAWPNEPFSNPEPPSVWFAVENTSSILAPLDIGAHAWQETGTFYVHVMAPVGTGSEAARTAAKNVANVYRVAIPGPVTYRSASIGHGVASDPEGMWWMLTVSIDWIYQDVISS